VRREFRLLLSILLGFVLNSAVLSAQHGGRRGGPLLGAPRFSSGGTTVAIVNPYPTFGLYGNCFPQFFEPPAGPGFAYLPNYWWAGANASADPRQDGYNPSSGYAWESVAILLLESFPPKARVILDGTYVGTADSLGPTQLPLGEHTLRVEARSYEASETILKIDQPVTQQLEVRLKPLGHAAKPSPQQ
jgi:hypothetical protein